MKICFVLIITTYVGLCFSLIIMINPVIVKNIVPFEFSILTNRKRYPFPKYKENPIKDFYEKTFDNQKSFGKKISKLFEEDTCLFNVLAIAPTQSGKTGSMIAVIYEFFKSDTLRMPKNNIFIFTGLSSIDWLEQTKKRFPTWLHKHIYHRNNVNEIIDEVKNLKNILIIIDECHIAEKENQTLSKLFSTFKIKDLNHVYKTNIKIVQFTATPNCLYNKFKDLKHMGHNISYMDVPDTYLSVEKLKKQNRVYEASDLCGIIDKDDCIDINKHINEPINEDIYANIQKLEIHLNELETSYHIIRTPRGILHNVVIQNFKKTFANKDYVYISEPTMKPGEFDELLFKKPDKHTFIFIKDKLRCAKTIHHKYIGILYDRVVQKPNESSILQGLLGRLTGYHNNKKAIVYINKFTN